MAQKNLQGNWKQFRHDARARWENLTDSDLDRLATSFEDMVNTIQKRYKYSRRRAEKEVRRFAREYGTTGAKCDAAVPATRPPHRSSPPPAGRAGCYGIRPGTWPAGHSHPLVTQIA